MKRIISLSFLAILITLSIATFIEKYKGTPYVDTYIYDSWAFKTLWAVIAITGFACIIKRKLFKRLPEFILHTSLLVILIGALITSLTAQRGTIHLTPYDNMSMYTAAGNGDCNYKDMPIILHLDKFEIKYYSGTQTPSDFVSHLTVTDKTSGYSFKDQVSMNHILSYKGYRFYQASFNPSEESSILSVNSDPWGIAVTYIGYGLLFLASFLLLINPQGIFRKLLKHPLLKKNLFVIFFFISSTVCFASGRVLPKEQAASIDQLEVLYNGRIAPMQTLAYNFTQKITGNDNYKGLTPEQVFTGWLLWPESWENEPMIKIKDNEFCKKRGITNPAKFSDLFTTKGEYRLNDYWQQVHAMNDPNQSAISQIDEKIELISTLRKETLLKTFPQTINGKTTWYAPSDSFPADIPIIHQLVIRNTLSLWSDAIINKDPQQAQLILNKIKQYQKKNGGTSYLSQSKVNAEIIYNKIHFTKIFYRISLTLGLVLLILTFREILQTKQSQYFKYINITFYCLQIGLFTFISLGLFLRIYISGQLPMSNGYETMLLLSWCIVLISIIWHRKITFILPFGFLLSGFCSLVANLGQMNPQVTNLMPVLNSPLLCIHVSMLMMAYALLAFTFFESIMAVSLNLIHKSEQTRLQIEKLQIISQIFLYPSLTLLGSGIFVGAIWANISWGRYWSWDPKEVWALISFLVYSVAIHKDSCPILRKPIFYHIYMIIAFTTILMTYFGVNYFLGGMHSYANN
jgi:ABC-type transport system involved in cytochrome c biogenesis permease subunit